MYVEFVFEVYCIVLYCIEVCCVPCEDVAHVGHVHKTLPQLLVHMLFWTDNSFGCVSDRYIQRLYHRQIDQVGVGVPRIVPGRCIL